MSAQQKLIQEFPNLQTYFHEVVTQTLHRQKIEANEHVSFYLVNLLDAFSKAESILRDDDGTPMPLVVLFCKAQAEEASNKARLLKYLGDFTLLFSGFFQDHFARKQVDIDYYIAMGGTAYQQLSSLDFFKARTNTLGMIFSELATHFPKWVDVLTEVGEVSHLTSQANVLRLYEKFLKTGSDRLRSLLAQQGIFANENQKTDYAH